ncbi:MAG TPA: RNA 2',3'-cyclic phosphodiesterase [Burkholderiales bacterium]|nr:RNA 2',3'-cyclic phosphodiesterase [Burkholderiales bacterium]
MRLFFALWPPAETAAALCEWGKALNGKPTPKANIHLTLAFLGDAEAEKAVSAAKRVRARKHELPIEEARFWKKNEIVWAGPRAMPAELDALVKSLHLELYRDEFILERRPFAAHVTLLRKASEPKDLPPLPAVTWPVAEFLLVRSRPSASGQTYEPVERFPLSE